MSCFSDYANGFAVLFQRTIKDLRGLGKAIDDELMTSRARAYHAYAAIRELKGQWKAYQEEHDALLARTLNMKPFNTDGPRDVNGIEEASAKLQGMRLPSAGETRQKLIWILHQQGYSAEHISNAFSLDKKAVERIIGEMGRKNEHEENKAALDKAAATLTASEPDRTARVKGGKKKKAS